MFYASPFKISMFSECPRRYKFQYIDKLAEQFKVAKPHFTMGENVHKSLKDFFELPEPERTYPKLEELLRDNWREKREGFKDREEEKKFGEAALKMLKDFTEKEDLKINPIALEQTYKVPLNEEIMLMGRIDRIDEKPDGLSIIDYKTGSVPDEEDKLQLAVYAIMVNKKIQKPVKHAIYLYLKSGKKYDFETTEEILEKELDILKKKISEILLEKEFKPNINKFCGFCEYISICPKKEEIQKNNPYQQKEIDPF